MNDADSKRLEKIKNKVHTRDELFVDNLEDMQWFFSKIIEQDREIDVLLQQASDREMWKADAEKAEAEVGRLRKD